MKKLSILIPNAGDTNNIGDFAILKSLVNIVSNSIKTSSISVHCVDPKETRARLHVRTRRNIVHELVFKPKGFLKIWKFTLFLHELLLSKFKIKKFINRDLRQLLNDYASADIIIYSGGGYLRSSPGFFQSCNLLVQLFPFVFTRFYKAKKIVAPISFGPFAYEWQTRYAAKILKKFDLVTAREKYSYALLKKHNVNNVLLSTDSALFLRLAKRKIGKKKEFILGFTIRKWLQRDQQDKFENEFVAALEEFAKTTNVSVQPIVQVDAPEYGDFDSELTSNIAEKLKKRAVQVLPIKKVKDLEHASKIYGEIDLLLGMRMHSNILASLQGTPFVAIAYEHKTDGLSRQLGLGKYCIRVEKADRKSILAKLVDAYKNLPALEDRIYESINIIQSKEPVRWKVELKKSLALAQ